MELKDLPKTIFALVQSINEESSNLELYNTLMKIGDKALEFIEPDPLITPDSFLVDKSTPPAVLVVVSVASKKLSNSHQAFHTSIKFNRSHKDNILTRIPVDLTDSRQSAFLQATLLGKMP